jgi:hypothetical protein
MMKRVSGKHNTLKNETYYGWWIGTLVAPKATFSTLWHQHCHLDTFSTFDQYHQLQKLSSKLRDSIAWRRKCLGKSLLLLHAYLMISGPCLVTSATTDVEWKSSIEKIWQLKKCVLVMAILWKYQNKAANVSKQSWDIRQPWAGSVLLGMATLIMLK